MNLRDQLLAAAARVYAEVGYRGATTRRIAQEAGVNEITLFRHFGSKDALLQESIALAACGVPLGTLPDPAIDPADELTAWARSHIAHLVEHRSLIRTCMGEMEEHPGLVSSSVESPTALAAAELAAYLRRLQERGLALPGFDPQAAAAMLMGALFGDAMGRDVIPAMFRTPLEESLNAYVQLFLRAIGLPQSVPVASP